MDTETKVFQSGNNLAIRLVSDGRIPCGTKVRQHREGNRIIIETIDEWPPEFLALAGS